MGDPVEQTLETETVEVERQLVAGSGSESRLMNPYPNVSQQERHDQEEQSQVRVAGTGVNLSLPGLAVAGLNAETRSVTLADFGRRTGHSPDGKEQFLLSRFAGFVMPVATVVHADRKRGLLAVASEGMRVSASRLATERTQTGKFATFFWCPAREFDRHQKRQAFRL